MTIKRHFGTMTWEVINIRHPGHQIRAKDIDTMLKVFVYFAALLLSFEAAWGQKPAGTNPLIGTWAVTVEGIPDNAPRTLIISSEPGVTEESNVVARYGIASKSKSLVEAKIIIGRESRQLVVITQAASNITANEQADGSFTGNFVTKSGERYPVKIARAGGTHGDRAPLAAHPVSSTTNLSSAPTAAAAKNIMMINMGGDDCPPCVSWRRFELPKLQATEAFKAITFVHVEKTAGSTVPPRVFLPDNVKPLMERLDIASGGRGGSPQAAIVVNGEVYDYYFGTRSAVDIEKMILSIQNSSKYPFERCTRRKGRTQCAEVGPP